MSAGVLIDPINAIQGELVANAAVLAIVSANPVDVTFPRVYVEKVPDSPSLDPTYTDKLAAQIVIVGAPGLAFERAIASIPRFELRAYAPRTSDARDLAYLAMNAINERTIRRGGVVCYVSFASDMGGTTPTQNVDPETGTPFYFAFFAATTYAGNPA